MMNSNMNQKTILFDLDGTLTDSGEGIFYCTEAVLRHYQLPIPERANMRFMVGPPLTESFPKFGIRTEDLSEAVAIYREHYNAGGQFMNTPYPGISQLLRDLKHAGFQLCVATSKPESMARVILEHFNLAQYFDLICGASDDGKRSTKSDVIAYLLESCGDSGNMIMIGDTIYDVLGAAEFAIPTIGVAWGYGNTEDMRASGAVAIAENSRHLLQIIYEKNRID